MSKYSPFAQSLIDPVQSELLRLACKRDQLLEEYDKAAETVEAMAAARAEAVGLATRQEIDRTAYGAQVVKGDLSRKLMACDKEAGDLIRGTGAEFIRKDGHDEARAEAREALWEIYLGEAADHAWYAK